jgi:hypothetical protein
MSGIENNVRKIIDKVGSYLHLNDVKPDNVRINDEDILRERQLREEEFARRNMPKPKEHKQKDYLKPRQIEVQDEEHVKQHFKHPELEKYYLIYNN